jgi:hypothetical protein
MAGFEVQFRELFPPGVEQEFDQLTTNLNAAFNENHHAGTGEHSDVILDTLAARNSSNVIPLTGSIRFLKGRIMLDEPGNSVHVAGLRPAQWTGDVHNYNPPGSQHSFTIECDTDSDRSITGIERHARQKQLIIFGNRGNFNITLEHNHASSTVYNRFGLPNSSDVVVGSGEYIWLYYDVGSELWRAVSVL